MHHSRQALGATEGIMEEEKQSKQSLKTAQQFLQPLGLLECGQTALLLNR